MSLVTIYRHPQLVLPVQQYHHNVNNVVALQHVPLAIAVITWHLPPRALNALISQTAIVVAKLLMCALPAIVDITWHLLLRALDALVF